MKTIRKATRRGKVTVHTYPRVDHLKRLLGNDVLMLAWPRGEKGVRRRWKHLTREIMEDAAYLAELEAGNIGIALGEKSNDLCSIDWDNDEWMHRFLESNPALQKSLRTKGERGCNIWVRLVGDYPDTYKIKTLPTSMLPKGEEVGEWRASNSQTIISGQHPNGCAYSFVVEGKPAELAFKDICWPDGLQIRQADNGQLIAHSLTVPVDHSTLTSSHKLSQVGIDPLALFDVLPYVPKQRGQSDRSLWEMAGRLKRLEIEMQRPTTFDEKNAIFRHWWLYAESFVDPSKDAMEFLSKWLSACKGRRLPDNETALTTAWKAARSERLPSEVTDIFGTPMPHKMQQLVSLCRQLQLLRGVEPFFLGSRDAGRLLEVPYRTVAHWLALLANEDGPGILRKVRTGSQAARRANEYLYVSLITTISDAGLIVDENENTTTAVRESP